MTCKECGKSFHYCGACGYNGYSELGFCSTYCRDKAHDRASEKLRKVLAKLTKEEVEILDEFKETVNMEYCDFVDYIETGA